MPKMMNENIPIMFSQSWLDFSHFRHENDERFWPFTARLIFLIDHQIL